MATDWRMIRLDKDGPLAIVTLTNPPLNVLHPQMAAELEACFTGLATDPEVVVAILTGQGERAFCAGFDIKEFPTLMAPGGAERLTRALHASLGKIAHLGNPPSPRSTAWRSGVAWNCPWPVTSASWLPMPRWGNPKSSSACFLVPVAPNAYPGWWAPALPKN